MANPNGTPATADLLFAKRLNAQGEVTIDVILRYTVDTRNHTDATMGGIATVDDHLRFVAGTYEMHPGAPDSELSAPAPVPVLEDLHVTARADFSHSAGSGTVEYGIEFGLTAPGTFYRYSINPDDGAFSLRRFNQGAMTQLNFGTLPGVEPGTAVNNLRVLFSDDTIYFTVNDTFPGVNLRLYEYALPSAEGGISLFVTSGSADDVFRVDNFSIGTHFPD